MVSYWGSDSSQHVFFIGTDDHVHELYIAPGTNGWSDNDLTALTAGAQSTPNVNTALAGFWDGENGQHLYYISNDGGIHEIYTFPGAGWTDHNLTHVVHAVAPNLGTALDVYRGQP